MCDRKFAMADVASFASRGGLRPGCALGPLRAAPAAATTEGPAADPETTEEAAPEALPTPAEAEAALGRRARSTGSASQCCDGVPCDGRCEYPSR